MTKEEFCGFVKESLEFPDEFEQETQKVLALVEKELHLTPEKHPWEKIKQLQDSFEYGKISFSNEYYDTLGEERPDGTVPAERRTAFAEAEADTEQ